MEKILRHALSIAAAGIYRLCESLSAQFRLPASRGLDCFAYNKYKWFCTIVKTASTDPPAPNGSWSAPGLSAIPVYFFSLSADTTSVSASLIAAGALMMDMKLLLPIMLRSGKLMAMRNLAKRWYTLFPDTSIS